MMDRIGDEYGADPARKANITYSFMDNRQNNNAFDDTILNEVIK